MKLAKLTDARFHTVFRKLSLQPLPLRVAFKLKGISAKIDVELKKFEGVRHDALKRFGKKDDKGEVVTKPDGTVEFEPDQLKAFAAELNEVGQIDIDVGNVKLDDFGAKFELSAEEVAILGDILVE